ncbi:MAG: hypothetical protein ACO3A4_12935 [Silvanigrellaceae bacterium]
MIQIQVKTFIFACAISALSTSCKQRGYNQSKTKDLVGGGDSMVTLCSMVSPFFQEAPGDVKAGVRVSCQGQCNGADYRTRKFYVANEEKVLGMEFSAKLTSGKEIRNLFVFAPESGLMSSLTSLKLESTEIQKSLADYSLDPANVANLAIPADGKILLATGTKASLSNAGLQDGGTLDCGGQPVDGAVELEQFKEQNLKDVKNSTATP